MSIILANIIFLFHCLIIAFVILAPFSNIPALLVLHISFTICLFVHWYANSNACSLSLLEASLRGTDTSNTFTHQFIAPMYDISSSDWSNFVWIITTILLCISLYTLYNNTKFKEAWNCYTNNKHMYNCLQVLLAP